MQPSLSLQFNGTCREAFDAYCKHLGAEIKYTYNFGGTPAGRDVPDDWQDKIVHAAIDLNGMEIRGHDTPPGHYEETKGVYILVSMPMADVQPVYDALSAGGEVMTKLGKTFWSPAYGIFRDRFGIQWKIMASSDADDTGI